MTNNLPFNLPTPITTDSTTLPCCITGCVAFSTTLALSTITQLKLLTVSTGTKPPIPTAIGLLSVGLASLASHSAAVKTHALVKFIGGNDTIETRNRFQRNTKDDVVVIGGVRVASNALRICCVGLITFKLLGGRFWAISPSSYTHLGSFARWSLPATDAYASTSQRSSIERLGRWVGCHTCGSRELFSSLKQQKVKFHADHMPPRAVTRQMNARWWRRFMGRTVTQRFYPQCVTCSNNQGGILARAAGELEKRSSGMITGRVPNLAKAGAGRQAYFHGFRFRTSHLTGAVIAGLTVHNSKDWDVMNGNERRFKKLEFTARKYLEGVQKTLVTLSKR